MASIHSIELHHIHNHESRWSTSHVPAMLHGWDVYHYVYAIKEE